jgi:hypothetical protein
MSKNEAIDIFLRVRPTSEPFKGFSNFYFILEIIQEENKV